MKKLEVKRTGSTEQIIKKKKTSKTAKKKKNSKRQMESV